MRDLITPNRILSAHYIQRMITYIYIICSICTITIKIVMNEMHRVKDYKIDW